MGSRVDVMGYGHPTAVYITSNKTKVNTNKDKHDLMSEKYFARQVVVISYDVKLASTL